MELILFIIAVSILFPGSSDGDSFDLWMIPVFIICAAVFLGYFAALTYAAVFIAEWTDNGALGAAAGLGLFLATLFISKWTGDRAQRRRMLAVSP